MSGLRGHMNVACDPEYWCHVSTRSTPHITPRGSIKSRPMKRLNSEATGCETNKVLFVTNIYLTVGLYRVSHLLMDLGDKVEVEVDTKETYKVFLAQVQGDQFRPVNTSY